MYSIKESRDLQYERDCAGNVIQIITGRSSAELTYSSPNLNCVIQISDCKNNQKYQEFLKAQQSNQETWAEMIVIEMYLEERIYQYDDY